METIFHRFDQRSILRLFNTVFKLIDNRNYFVINGRPFRLLIINRTSELFIKDESEITNSSLVFSPHLFGNQNLIRGKFSYLFSSKLFGGDAN